MRVGGGGYAGTIVVDIGGVRKASAVLADDAYAFQQLAARVRGHALPEMPDGVAGRVTAALAEVGSGLAALPPMLIALAQELRVRAFWAEIADTLTGGHDLKGAQLAEFKAAYASGLLTRYAEPWEADLAKAYAKKLDEHHGGSILDDVVGTIGNLGSDALSGVEDAGNWAYQNVVIPTANGAATVGNAFINDPSDAASTLLGGLMIGGGFVAEGGGTVLDATGVGAVAGVPLNVVGAGAIATGAGLAAKGALGLANYATEHPTQVLQARSQGAREQDPGYGARPEPPENVPADANPYDPKVADRVPAYGENGDKTTGALEVNGTANDELIVSGKDGPGADPANGGAGTGRNGNVYTHVESHAGAILKSGDNGTLYINREPCPGCDKNLPRFVPEGATLTIYGPNGYVNVVEGTGPPR